MFRLRSNLPGRIINPRLLRSIYVLKYELLNLRIRKWQIHGHNYIMQLICWGTCYRKTRVPWKRAHTSWVCRRERQLLSALRKCRGGVIMFWFPWRSHSVLSSWDKLLCHPPSARAYHVALLQATQLAYSPRLEPRIPNPPGMEGGHRKEQLRMAHVPFLLYVWNSQDFCYLDLISQKNLHLSPGNFQTYHSYWLIFLTFFYIWA